MNISALITIVAEEVLIPPEATSFADFYNLSNSSFTFSTSATEEGLRDVSGSLASTRLVVQTIITPIVITIGLLGNFFNILVLVQPNMRNSTNVYLLTLAMADSVYLIFSFTLSFLGCRRRGLTYTAYAFNTYGRTISDIAGNIAVWIIVIFTVERYVAVCHPIHGKIWCTVRRAKLFSLVVVFLCLANTAPGFFELEIKQSSEGPYCQYTAFANSPAYELGYTWWYVTIFTFIPFVFLVIFNSLLIHTLIRASRDRQLFLLGANRATPHQARRTGLCSVLNRRRLACFWKRHQLSRAGESVSLCCFPLQERECCCRGCYKKVCVVRVEGDHEMNCSHYDGPDEDAASRISCLACLQKDRLSFCKACQGTQLLSIQSSNGKARNYGCAERKSHVESFCLQENQKPLSSTASDRLGFKLLANQNGGGNCFPTPHSAIQIPSPASYSPSPAHSCLSSSPSLSSRGRDAQRSSRRCREQNKVTLMLTVIVIIFFLCQLPWTSLYIYRAYLSAHNVDAAGSDAMKIAGNVVNLLAQVNASGNFYLYSFFSKRFRRTLARLFFFWRSEVNTSSVHL